MAETTRVSEEMVTAYTKERENWLRNCSAARAGRVRDLLSGQRVDVSSTEATLGCRLRQHHLGVVCWTSNEAIAVDEALGALIIAIEHVGSTSVQGLPAKPVIDIDLLIEDTADESRYVPALETRGYRLVLREPWWYGHRMLVSPAEDVHLHMWPHDSPEPVRHRLFRDWLRSHPSDRDLYAAAKRRLARDTVDRPGDYSLAKNDVIDEIYERIFAAGTDEGDR